jgi:hypothetical protein
MPEPFAIPEDVEDIWRPLTEQETRIAENLLGRASRMVRRRFSTIDARIASGDLDPKDAADVVSAMVKRAMLTADGVTQRTQTGGPFSDTEVFANPMGNLFFTNEDLSALEDSSLSGGRRAFSIDLAPDAGV